MSTVLLFVDVELTGAALDGALLVDLVLVVFCGVDLLGVDFCCALPTKGARSKRMEIQFFMSVGSG